MGKSKLIKKGLVQKAKRNNGGMDIQGYNEILKVVGKYELRNKKLEKEFAKQNKQKGEEESKTIKQEEIQHKVESEKSIKKENGVVSGKNGEDNNSVTFKEERKQFIQGLSRAQSYGQIVTAQYVAEQRQIKMLQAIER